MKWNNLAKVVIFNVYREKKRDSYYWNGLQLNGWMYHVYR